MIPVKLNAPLVSGGNVDVFDTFKVSLDDNFVVYTADQDTDEVKELYSTPLVFDVDIKDIIYIINLFSGRRSGCRIKGGVHSESGGN